MKFLVDTHLLVWAAAGSDRLSRAARLLIANPSNEVVFSAASIGEVAIKSSLGRHDFRVDAAALRVKALASDYSELAVLSAHAIFASRLPAIHKDPFDRILVAQATVEV